MAWRGAVGAEKPGRSQGGTTFAASMASRSRMEILRKGRAKWLTEDEIFGQEQRKLHVFWKQQLVLGLLPEA